MKADFYKLQGHANLAAIQEIGWLHWNPIGLDAPPASPADEYDTYLIHAVGMLTLGKSIDEVFTYLVTCAEQGMGLPACDRKAARITASALAQCLTQTSAEALDASDPNLVSKALKRIVGLPAWNVMNGIGTSLTFEFGPPHLYIREPHTPKAGASAKVTKFFARRSVRAVGAHHLWLFQESNWRLSSYGKDIATADQNMAAMKRAVRELDGQKLMTCKIDPATSSTQFIFDLGAIIETHPTDNAEQWYLYDAGMVLAFRADGHFSFGSSNVEPSEEVWRPMQEPIFVSV